MSLGILDLLGLLGFRREARTLLVRHQSKNPDPPIQELLQTGWFELYQAFQKRQRFHNIDQIVSFYATTGTRAQFYGVYHVDGVTPSLDVEIPHDCPWAEDWRSNTSHFYILRPDHGFDELSNRVIIDWGLGTRQWVQKLSNKPVLEILEPGRVLPPFNDYLEFTLSFAQLRNLINSANSHREWCARLQAVAGVYLILAEKTGDLYVGSAYGGDGIWGRWRNYAKSGHGNNLLLRNLIERDPEYPERFRFSLLQILPKSMAREEVIERERIYKLKLGTRATGLNLN